MNGKLVLLRALSVDLPAMPEKPGLNTHAWNQDSADIWQWIYGKDAPAPFDSPACRPETVFFSASYASDVSVVALRDCGDGVCEVTHLATHPWQKGMNYGRCALLYAMEQMRERGYHTVRIALEPEQCAAIHTVRMLGFMPDEKDPETVQNWTAAEKAMANYHVEKVRSIRLWPGESPYPSADGFVPSVKPCEVENSHAAVIICPGGGYRIKASHEGETIARMINAAGISAFVLDYHVYPCHYMAPLADAQRAIRLVRSMGYKKVFIMGFSAGGHLCCSAATLYDAGKPDAEDPLERLSCRPDGFIPCYPVASFVNHPHRGSAINLLGDQADNQQLLRKFSAELNVTPDTPPAFIWHTMTDAAVPVENSLNLAAALSEAKVPFELHIFPEGPHGLGLGIANPAVRQWSALCQKWLLLQAEPGPTCCASCGPN